VDESERRTNKGTRQYYRWAVTDSPPSSTCERLAPNKHERVVACETSFDFYHFVRGDHRPAGQMSSTTTLGVVDTLWFYFFY
jgi:hypothetical protein